MKVIKRYYYLARLDLVGVVDSIIICCWLLLLALCCWCVGVGAKVTRLVIWRGFLPPESLSPAKSLPPQNPKPEASLHSPPSPTPTR